MLQEMNKIAIIHLFLLGFEEELDNFTLSLTNPSTQADLMKIDVWKEKIATYRECVTDPGSGILPVSASWAKKHVLGMSDEEIKLDLQQQRIEKAVGAELQNTATIITKTGIFDNIDKLYGVGMTGGTAPSAAPPPPPEGGAPPPLPPPPGGGGAPPPPPGGGGGELQENKKDNLKILLENDDFLSENIYLDLSKAKQSLGEMESELNKLLND
jgi:hypothetical protein